MISKKSIRSSIEPARECFSQFNLYLAIKPALLTCLVLFSVHQSFGFCFQPVPMVACEFLNSDAVFVGKVISVRDAQLSGEQDGSLYNLTVQELFRGPHTKTIEVFTENASARFPLEVGKQYLLFASELNGKLQIGACGNSALLSAAEPALRELRQLKIPRDAVIEGRISFSGIPDSGTHVPGIQVIVHSRIKIFKTTTDRDGWFRLHVPPGTYSAEVRQIPQWDIVPYDLSREDPRSFDAREGHCSRLQFVAGPK